MRGVAHESVDLCNLHEGDEQSPMILMSPLPQFGPCSTPRSEKRLSSLTRLQRLPAPNRPSTSAGLCRHRVPVETAASRLWPTGPSRPKSASWHRPSWPRPLKRAFDHNLQHDPNSGAGELKIIAAILERPVIEKILTRLGLEPQALPKAP